MAIAVLWRLKALGYLYLRMLGPLFVSYRQELGYYLCLQPKRRESLFPRLDLFLVPSAGWAVCKVAK
jgi:hypothetical protein